MQSRIYLADGYGDNPRIVILAGHGHPNLGRQITREKTNDGYLETETLGGNVEKHAGFFAQALSRYLRDNPAVKVLFDSERKRNGR